MSNFNISIESAARMNPSTVLSHLPDRPRVECGCCHAIRDQVGKHAILGPLCVWCTRAFDYNMHGTDGIRVRGWETCPFCLEVGTPCELHDQ